ncbi:MAG TPA: hypothetical protein VI956_04700 [Nitrospirota bacterium]|nr:hypothetical protein [Nitrospirota bacterium]
MDMIVNLEKKERDLLVTELEKTAIPELRVLIASGLRKDDREELKQDEAALRIVLEKLKMAA